MTGDKYIVLYVERKYIKWSRHTGHANDPISICLRHTFGIPKGKLLFSVGGFYMKHKSLTVIVHDVESPLLMHSYELSHPVKKIMWQWFKHIPINPFNVRITFTKEQIDTIIEFQRINRLLPTGINLLKTTTNEEHN